MSSLRSVVEAGIWHLKFARQQTLDLIKPIPADKMTYQPFPGANHVLWNLGHLGIGDAYFVGMLGGKHALPESWEKLFGMGSKPTPNPKDYPSLQEVLDQIAAAHEVLVKSFAGLSDAKLAEPLPKEMSMFAPNLAYLAGSLAWHEGDHAGQIAVMRKAMGIAPRF